MAKSQAELDEKTRRRKQELQRSSYCRVIESHIDPSNGAGVLVSESTLTRRGREPEIKAHFYRPAQLKRPFKEEVITSNHARIAVMDRLRDLFAGAKAAKVAPHDLKPGEVIANIWGANMQDVRFYIVVDVPSPRKVRVVQLPDRIASGNWFSGTKVPEVPDTLPGLENSYVYEVSMTTGAPYLKTGSSIERATRWSGKPVSVFSD